MIRKLAPREKRLLIAVLLLFGIGGNFLLAETFWSSRTRLRTEIQSQKRQYQLLTASVEEAAFWDQRQAWVREAQPKLSSAPDSQGVGLLTEIKDLARKHSVLIENPALRPIEPRPTHTAVTVEIETKSGWQPLIDFLHELQSPESFVAMESANLRIDASDPTMMRGRFKISRWYAP